MVGRIGCVTAELGYQQSLPSEPVQAFLIDCTVHMLQRLLSGYGQLHCFYAGTYLAYAPEYMQNKNIHYSLSAENHLS